jgi:hypothetical protein
MGTDANKAARRLIDRQPLFDQTTNIGLPQQVFRELAIRESADKTLYDQAFEAKDTALRFFFNTLYEQQTRVLERSPVFRQFYYRTINKHMEELSSEAAQQFVTTVGARAKLAGLSMEEYMGDVKTVQRLKEIAGKANHRGTAMRGLWACKTRWIFFTMQATRAILRMRFVLLPRLLERGAKFLAPIFALPQPMVHICIGHSSVSIRVPQRLIRKIKVERCCIAIRKAEK